MPVPAQPLNVYLDWHERFLPPESLVSVCILFWTDVPADPNEPGRECHRPASCLGRSERRAGRPLCRLRLTKVGSLFNI